MPCCAKAVIAGWQALTDGQWHLAAVALSQFNGIDLRHLHAIAVGVGDPGNPTTTGMGTVYLDDIGIAAVGPK